MTKIPKALSATLLPWLIQVHGSLGEGFHKPKVEGVITQDEKINLWLFICDGSVKHFGHSFAFDAHKIWNELPHDVCSATSVASVRKKLKTYLFAIAYLP